MKSREHEGCGLTREELTEVLREAHPEIIDFQFKLSEDQRVEPALAERRRDLGERVKESECLDAVSRCRCRSEADLPQLVQGTVNCLPSGCQNPKLTWAPPEIAVESAVSLQFQITPDSHAAAIFIPGWRAGALCVHGLAKSSPDGDPPMHPTVSALLQTVA